MNANVETTTDDFSMEEIAALIAIIRVLPAHVLDLAVGDVFLRTDIPQDRILQLVLSASGKLSLLDAAATRGLSREKEQGQ